MSRGAILVVLLFSSFSFSQNPPPSDPQALSYAAKSIAAMTAGNSISDVMLTGNVTWSGSDTGTATLMALGTGESRMDLVLSTGTRTEIRDARTGGPRGRWVNPNGKSGEYSSHNCWTDAAWFFPALSSLAGRRGVVFTYIGQETRDGSAVQHIQSYIYQANRPSRVTPSPRQLSTTDFYLDATTFLPVAIVFSAHPDNDASTNIGTEVDFSNYQSMSGVAVPTHIQRYQQGALMVDLAVTSAAFNTGLSLSTFAIN